MELKTWLELIEESRRRGSRSGGTSNFLSSFTAETVRK